MVCIIYVIAGYDAHPSIAYAAHLLGKRRGQPLPEEKVLKALVEDAFLNVDTVHLDEHLNDDNPLGPHALEEAWAWYTEWQLRTWVMEKNYVQGVAPATRSVLT